MFGCFLFSSSRFCGLVPVSLHSLLILVHSTEQPVFFFIWRWSEPKGEASWEVFLFFFFWLRGLDVHFGE